MRSFVSRFAQGLGLLATTPVSEGKVLGNEALKIPEADVLRVEARARRASVGGRPVSTAELMRKSRRRKRR